jgi:hypothetical protein
MIFTCLFPSPYGGCIRVAAGENMLGGMDSKSSCSVRVSQGSSSLCVSLFLQSTLCRLSLLVVAAAASTSIGAGKVTPNCMLTTSNLRYNNLQHQCATNDNEDRRNEENVDRSSWKADHTVPNALAKSNKMAKDRSEQKTLFVVILPSDRLCTLESFGQFAAAWTERTTCTCKNHDCSKDVTELDLCCNRKVRGYNILRQRS